MRLIRSATRCAEDTPPGPARPRGQDVTIRKPQPVLAGDGGGGDSRARGEAADGTDRARCGGLIMISPIAVEIGWKERALATTGGVS